MLFFSRWQKIALVVLALALLVGVSVLMYARGRASALASDAPFFSEPPPLVVRAAPSAVAATPEAPGGAAASESAPPAGPAVVQEAPSAAVSVPRLPPGASSRTRASRRGPKVPPKRRIPLNSASAEQLQQLPGIGPVLAARIVQYRAGLKAVNGRGFESMEQLLEVSGIGPKKYANLRDCVSL